MRNSAGTRVGVAGMLALAITLIGCSGGGGAEQVVTAADATGEGFGTFEVEMDFGTFPGEDDAEARPMTLSGSWDGESYFLDMEDFFDVSAQEFADDMAEASEDGVASDSYEIEPEPGDPTQIGFLVRGDETLGLWRIDGEERWFEDAGQTGFEASSGTFSPASMRSWVRDAAEDPDAVIEVGDATYEVPLARGQLDSASIELGDLLEDPSEVIGYSGDPEGVRERLERIDRWLDEITTASATIELDDGRVRTLDVRLEVDEEARRKYEDCRFQTYGAGSRITYTYTAHSELPNPAEVGTAEELTDILSGFDAEEYDEDALPDEVDEQLFETSVGPMARVDMVDEIAWIRASAAEDAGEDYVIAYDQAVAEATALPDDQLVAAFEEAAASDPDLAPDEVEVYEEFDDARAPDDSEYIDLEGCPE